MHMDMLQIWITISKTPQQLMAPQAFEFAILLDHTNTVEAAR